MDVCFAKHTRKYPLKNRGLLLRSIRKIASLSGLSNLLPESKLSISVILVDDDEITQMNEQFLQHEGPTDVISFDYKEDYCSDDDEPFTIGELFISLDTASRQAEEYGKTLNDELLLYIAHGILHICGYDDHTPFDVNEMREAEKRVIDGLFTSLGKVEVI
jgi:probable rRNA maturation factor